MEIRWRQVVLLIGSLLVALVPWLMSLNAWCDAVNPGSVGILAGIIGGVLLAWIGESPLPPRK